VIKALHFFQIIQHHINKYYPIHQVMCNLSFLFLLAFLTTSITIASSFKIDDGDAIDLFTWAKQHGAKISPSIQIQSTPYGGRGLFVTHDIPFGTELILIPYHLQLGIRQLAEGNDSEMQQMAKALPWEYIIKNEIGFIVLSLALVAEKRKGADSIFHPFLKELPQYCSNAVGRGDDNDLNNLIDWAPTMARRVQQMRQGIRTIHESISSSSVSIEDLQWAATNVCSRSLVRKRIKDLTADQIDRVGGFAASDHSRMLPVIDLVNHGSLELANVKVGHFSHGNDDDNDFSTSLKSTRDIKAGEELLFDYGGEGGKKISNDRLLLDYGFVLPGHIDKVSISLEEFVTSIKELEADRVGMKSVSDENMKELDTLIVFLTKQSPLLFFAGSEPTVHTLAVAIILTCRDSEDVSRVLKPAHEVKTQEDANLLPGKIVDTCSDMQKVYAQYALKRAATLAFDQRPTISDDCKEEEMGRFANVAREYSILSREKLKEVADMSS